MKVAEVCPRIYPNIGGVERHVEEICMRLPVSFDLEVVCADRTAATASVTEYNGIPIQRFNAWDSRDIYFFAPAIRPYLERASYDLIHAHNYHAFPAYFASRVKQVPFVFTPHYHGRGATPFRTFLHAFYRRFGTRILSRADAVICVSNHEKQLLLRHFPTVFQNDDKMVVIPNGVPLGDIRAAVPFPFDGRLIVYVGRLDAYKNIHRVIEAMPLLPDYSFYIIGNRGDHREALEALIEKYGVEDRVKILDDVSDADKYRWLHTASVLVTLSSLEAFGITVLEALAAGTPAIVNQASGLGDFAEIFDDSVTALDLAALTPEALAQTISSVNGRVRPALDDYEWDAIAARVADVYRGLLE